MMKHLTVFRIIYLLFLLFVLIHFVLGLFGLAFTPVLWNICFSRSSIKQILVRMVNCARDIHRLTF